LKEKFENKKLNTSDSKHNIPTFMPSTRADYESQSPKHNLEVMCYTVLLYCSKPFKMLLNGKEKHLAKHRNAHWGQHPSRIERNRNGGKRFLRR